MTVIDLAERRSHATLAAELARITSPYRLLWAARYLGRHVGAGRLDAHEVATELVHAARCLRMTESDTHEAIVSGLQAGIADHRNGIADLTLGVEKAPDGAA